MADITVTAASVDAGVRATTRNVIAGGTITAGMAVYKDVDAADVYKPAQADAAVTALAEGVALNAASTGQPLTIATGGGAVNLGAALVVGQTYVVSPTAAGGIGPISDLGSGHFPTILGIAESTALLKMGILYGSTVKP